MPVDNAMSERLGAEPFSDGTDRLSQPLLRADAASPGEIALRLNNVGKRFRTYSTPGRRLAAAFVPSLVSSEDTWAIRGVNLEIRRGEFFGIIGPNGSGKSTLLKMIAGSLYPTEGEITTYGRVLALLELGAGLNPELTARQNVAYAATMLGMPADYGRENMSAIEAFADIGPYFDRPMKLFSSGMFVRVAFALYMFLDPEIFIIDEALSVGDIFFQQKCAEAMRRLVSRGTTIILVTHDTAAVRAMCDRAALIRHGQCVAIGDPGEIVNLYHATLVRTDLTAAPPPTSEAAPVKDDLWRNTVRRESILHQGTRITTGAMEILGLRVSSSDDHPTLMVRTRDVLRIQMSVAAHATIVAPNLGISIADRFGTLIFAVSNLNARVALPSMAAGEVVDIEFELQINLAPGSYTLTAVAADKYGTDVPNSGVFHDQYEGLGPIKVFWDEPMAPFYGVADLPTRVTILSHAQD
jgi:lipopolysaccharide transport system ATP-binding protein